MTIQQCINFTWFVQRIQKLNIHSSKLEQFSTRLEASMVTGCNDVFLDNRLGEKIRNCPCLQHQRLMWWVMRLPTVSPPRPVSSLYGRTADDEWAVGRIKLSVIIQSTLLNANHPECFLVIADPFLCSSMTLLCWRMLAARCQDQLMSESFISMEVIRMRPDPNSLLQ
jgi:hypothetical protein